jgi:hypothetical protein
MVFYKEGNPQTTILNLKIPNNLSDPEKSFNFKVVKVSFLSFFDCLIQQAEIMNDVNLILAPLSLSTNRKEWKNIFDQSRDPLCLNIK